MPQIVIEVSQLLTAALLIPLAAAVLLMLLATVRAVQLSRRSRRSPLRQMTGSTCRPDYAVRGRYSRRQS